MKMKVACEGCCEEIIEVERGEWGSLRTSFPEDERDVMSIADKNCKHVPATWVKVSETEHLILWREQ